MSRSLPEIVNSYAPDLPLSRASTIPSDWYVDPRMADLEQRTVFARSWQMVGRVEQLVTPGEYVACELPAGEPIVVIRDATGILRAFFNVCRHHAAAVVADGTGAASTFRCPYHGWTYGLDGTLKGTPDFTEVCAFDLAANGLVPIDVDVWEHWVFVRVAPEGPSLGAYLGASLIEQVGTLALPRFRWVERRTYSVGCNWKVFVDNYLDGGYHIPHLHKRLDRMLIDAEYTIDLGERACLQSSPLTEGEPRGGRSGKGERAHYYWLHPNFMINIYGGGMDTNLVMPRGVDRTDVIFDYYFADASAPSLAANLASIAVSEEIQHEDVAICESVQRGLRSWAYTAGRLSVRREAGEQLFHRLLHADLLSGLSES